MTLTNQLHVLRRLLLGGLLTTGMAFAFVMMSSGTANAGWGAGSGGGGGSGGGATCHVDMGWKYASSYAQFRDRTTAGCGWGSASAVFAQFKKVAGSCYSHRSTIIAIFYLNKTGTTSWMPGIQGAGYSAGYIKNNITRLTKAGNFGSKWNKYKPEIKSLARGKVKSNQTTVVCVWADQINTIPNTKCPKKDSGPVRKYIYKSRSQKLLPESLRKLKESTANNKKRGNWCAKKNPTKKNYTLTETRSSAGKKDDKSSKGYNIVDANPYAWNTNFEWGTENVTGDSTKDWKANLVSVKYTAWGNLISNVGNAYGGFGGSNDKAPTNASVSAALAADKTGTHGGATLSAHNKEVFARGGVVNAVERTSYYGLNERRTKKFTCTYSITTYYNFRLNQKGSLMNGPHVEKTKSTKSRCSTSPLPSSITKANKDKNAYGNWKAIDTDVKIRNDMYLAGTPQATALRQAMNVHCNKDGYEAATPNSALLDNNDQMEITKINVGDDAHHWSGAAAVKKTAKGDKINDHIVWGLNGSDSSKADTDKVGLFDKECAFNGVIKDGKKETTTSHFRNNDFKLGATEVDLFVPKKEGVVSPKAGEEAVSTTATRWSKGTPYAEGQPGAASEASGGTFAMRSKKSDENSDFKFFSNENETPAGQKNFTVTPYSTITSGLVPSQANKFYVAATWSSQKHAPQVLTFKYEYAPDVSTVIPTSVKFNSDMNANFTNEKVSVPIHGKIYSKPGSTESPAVNSSIGLDMFKVQQDNTGSKLVAGSTPSIVKNNADSELPFGGQAKIKNGKWTINNPRTVSPYYRVLRFVRATTE